MITISILSLLEKCIKRLSGISPNKLGNIPIHIGAKDYGNLYGENSSCMVLNGEIENILLNKNNRMRKASNIWTIIKCKRQHCELLIQKIKPFKYMI